MKNVLKLSLFLLFLFTFNITLAHTPILIKDNEKSLAPMLAKVTPTVVNIAVEKIIPSQFTSSKSDQRKLFGVGSGVIFNAEKGLIVTNAHVIRNAKIILVTLKDGRRYLAKLIGKDDGFDIAIIAIHAKNLTSIQFGDSDKLRVGDFVAAIGSPFGLDESVTSGVISALNRTEPKIEGFQSFIQTDAPINPGNSGGALVNLQGKLIAINTAIVAPSDGNIGIGFAIPSNMVKSVISQLLKYGKVEPSMLGVIAQNITPDLAAALGLKHSKGAIVTKVFSGTPAQQAGIQMSDIIEKINGKTINSSVQLRNMLGLMHPGTKISIMVIRDHKPMTLNAVVGDPKRIAKQRAIPYIAGLKLRNFSELEADGSNLKGVLVANVAETSAAALAGLLPGDVITAANSTPVDSVNALVKLAESAKNQLLLKVARDNSSLFLVIEKS